jgi:hypothetical protein
MEKRMRAATLLFCSLFLVASLSRADVVELKTGQRVEGTFKEATSGGVVIEVGGQTITFEKDKVRAIYFGTAPTSGSVQPSPCEAALTALKGLESVTKSGVNYAEYARRVLDAKVIVDRAFGSEAAPDQAAAQSRLQEAMQLYQFAASAWNTGITKGNYQFIPTDPAIALCPPALEAATALAKKFDSRKGGPSQIAIGVAFAGGGGERGVGIPELHKDPHSC